MMIRSLVAPPQILETIRAIPDDVPDDGEDKVLILRRNLSPESLEIALTDGSLVWMDISNPEDEDIRWLETTLRLHPAVVSDLRRDDRRPTLLVYPEYLFLSLFQAQFNHKEIKERESKAMATSTGETTLSRRAVVRRENGKRDHPRSTIEASEIHCLIGTHYFVTVRKEGSKAVDGAYDRAAKNIDYWRRDVAYLLYMTMQFVIDSYYPLLDGISNQLSSLEERAMVNGDKALQKSVFGIKQQLINLRQMVAPQREVISNVIGEERLASKPEDRDLFRHLYERLLRIYDVIDSQRDLAGNVLDLIESQESSNLAKAVGRLTVLSMLFLPPTFIVGLFGLNFVTTSLPFEIPFAGGWVFAFIVVLTLLMSAGIAWFFHRRGWL